MVGMEERENEMKFQIETKKLNDILKAVATATPKKTRIPVLQWIRIEASAAGNACFYATDLCKAFDVSASACVMAEGSALVEASQILKLVRAVKTDHVWIELDSDSGKLKIGPSFSLNTCNPEDYPEINLEEKDQAIVVSSQELKRLINDVKHCAAKHPHSVQGYCGIMFKAEGSKIISAAQDGWRLAESRLDVDPGQEWQKLFPEDQVKFLLNALPKKDCQVEVRNTKERLYFSWLDSSDHFEIAIFADSENGFMDYDGFFPDEFETQAWAPKKELLDAVRTVAVVATEQPKGKNAEVSYRMFFEAKAGNLKLLAESCGMEAQESIKIDGNSEFGVGLNCVFLEEMVKAIDSELVAFSCSGPEMPVYLWPDNQYKNRRQVVMSLTMR